MSNYPYQASSHSVLTDPFASNQTTYVHPNPSIHSNNNYAPLSRPLSPIGYNGGEGGNLDLDQDPEMVDLSTGTKGNRPLSQSNNTAYWSPNFIDGLGGSGGELSGPKADDRIGGSPYSSGGGFRRSGSGEEGWDDAYRDNTPWYKTKKAILVLVLISAIVTILSLGVGLGVGLGHKNQLSNEARLSSMSSASLASVSSQSAMNASLGIFTSIGYLTSAEGLPGAPGQLATAANDPVSQTAIVPLLVTSDPAPASAASIANVPATPNPTNAAFTTQIISLVPVLTQTNAFTTSLAFSPTTIPITSTRALSPFSLSSTPSILYDSLITSSSIPLSPISPNSNSPSTTFSQISNSPSITFSPPNVPTTIPPTSNSIINPTTIINDPTSGTLSIESESIFINTLFSPSFTSNQIFTSLSISSYQSPNPISTTQYFTSSIAQVPPSSSTPIISPVTSSTTPPFTTSTTTIPPPPSSTSASYSPPITSTISPPTTTTTPVIPSSSSSTPATSSTTPPPPPPTTSSDPPTTISSPFSTPTPPTSASTSAPTTIETSNNGGGTTGPIVNPGGYTIGSVTRPDTPTTSSVP